MRFEFTRADIEFALHNGAFGSDPQPDENGEWVIDDKATLERLEPGVLEIKVPTGEILGIKKLVGVDGEEAIELLGVPDDYPGPRVVPLEAMNEWLAVVLEDDMFLQMVVTGLEIEDTWVWIEARPR